MEERILHWEKEKILQRGAWSGWERFGGNHIHTAHRGKNVVCATAVRRDGRRDGIVRGRGVILVPVTLQLHPMNQQLTAAPPFVALLAVVSASSPGDLHLAVAVV